MKTLEQKINELEKAQINLIKKKKLVCLEIANQIEIIGNKEFRILSGSTARQLKHYRSGRILKIETMLKLTDIIIKYNKKIPPPTPN